MSFSKETLQPYSPASRQWSGFTVLEILVAIFVLGCVSAALMQAMAAADRIRGRGLAMMTATRLASNEIERIRNQAAFQDQIADSVYSEIVNGKEFEIQRTLIVKNLLGQEPEATAKTSVEIQVTVKGPGRFDPVLNFRMLQGYIQ